MTEAVLQVADSPRTVEQQELLDKVFRHVSEVSSLPTAAVRVLEVAADENTATGDLLRVVETDPALSVRVLRTVNSAYYALPHSVNDLRAAITLLGFKEVRNLALTVYVARLFKVTLGYRTYTRQGLWEHLMGVARAARSIANVCRKVPRDEAYLAGLLHDLGILLIDQQIHRRFRQVIDNLSEETPTCVVEQAILTFDHTELGEFVARRWRFPESIVAAIRYHHTPELYKGPHRELVAIVALANYLCSRKGLTSLGLCNAVPLPDSVFSILEIQRSHLSQIWQDLEESLGRDEAMIGIG